MKLRLRVSQFHLLVKYPYFCLDWQKRKFWQHITLPQFLFADCILFWKIPEKVFVFCSELAGFPGFLEPDILL